MKTPTYGGCALPWLTVYFRYREYPGNRAVMSNERAFCHVFPVYPRLPELPADLPLHCAYRLRDGVIDWIISQCGHLPRAAWTVRQRAPSLVLPNLQIPNPLVLQPSPSQLALASGQVRKL